MASAYAGAGSMAGTQPLSAPLGLGTKPESPTSLKEYLAAYAQYDPKTPLIDEPKLLFDDCVIFSTGTRMPQNTYCIVRGNKLVLIDAAFQCCQPALAGLLERGAEVAAVCFSHRHVPAVSNAAPETLALRDRGAKLFLHPLDAAHEQVNRAGFSTCLEDPEGHPLLREFGITAMLHPGHTEGHVIYHWSEHGGVAFAGDCCMGSSPAEAATGRFYAVRPPWDFTTDEEQLKASWRGYDWKRLPFRTLAPFHNSLVYDMGEAEMQAAMEPLQREELTPSIMGREIKKKPGEA